MKEENPGIKIRKKRGKTQRKGEGCLLGQMLLTRVPQSNLDRFVSKI